MNQIPKIIGIIFLLFAFFTTAWGNPTEDFMKLAGSMEASIEVLNVAVDKGLKKGGTLPVAEMIHAAEMIKTQAEGFLALAEMNQRPDWTFEADEIVEIAEELKEALEKERPENISGIVARLFSHYDNLLTLNPLFDRMSLRQHFTDLKVLVENENYEEAKELSEHMEGHARHLYFSSNMFGKKVWRKFVTKALDVSDDIADACADSDKATLGPAMVEMETQIVMLEKLIKD